MKRLEGIAVGKIVKRILKRPLLWLLRWATDEIDAKWQQGQGPPS